MIKKIIFSNSYFKELIEAIDNIDSAKIEKTVDLLIRLKT